MKLFTKISALFCDAKNHWHGEVKFLSSELLDITFTRKKVQFVTFSKKFVRVRPWLLENLRSTKQNPCLSERWLLLTNNKNLKMVIDRTFLFHWIFKERESERLLVLKFMKGGLPLRKKTSDLIVREQKESFRRQFLPTLIYSCKL